jgi:molybdopterin-synthase adenylyltransferase
VSRQHLLLPSSVGDAIASSGAAWGAFGVRRVPGDELYVIADYTVKEKVRRPAMSKWLEHHCSRASSLQPNIGVWYRVAPELNMSWDPVWRRRVSIRTDAFREQVNGWRQPGNATLPVLTVSISEGETPLWRAWLLNSEMTTPVSLEVVSESSDIYAIFTGAWPLDILASELVSVIGVGSIGSAAAEALIEYGIRRLVLVDPDRLQFHNLARHQLLAPDIGRLKVNAMKELLAARDPDADIHALALDVVEDANQVRSLFKESRIVIVCSDGVASRRAANHLACWAGTPAVFACVLEEGGIGEILRVRPGISACLTCQREALVEAGSFDPEPGLDLGYGTGSRHFPMTAVGGDLDLVGKLAAKAAVATLLERYGHIEQWLPGDHAVIGLQPPPDMPDPFDVDRAGEIKWSQTGRPRPGCPSCRPI